MDYNALQKRKAELIAAGTAIATAAEGRAFTDEERTSLDANDAELVTLNADLVRVERQRENERTMPVAEAPRIPSAIQVTNNPPPFASMGDQLMTIRQAAMGDTDARMKLVAAAAGSNEAVDSEGGFLLMPQFTSGIEQKMYETGQILKRVRQVEIGQGSNGLTLRTIDETSRATGSRFGGVRGYWTDEGDAITDSKPKFGKLELKLKKVAALGYATDELVEDVTAMTSIYEGAFRDELLFLVEDAIINGDGAVKPLGIVGAPATVSVAKETGQAAASILFQNILKMRSRMWGRSRANSVWLINQEVETVLPQMSLVVGTGGVPVYMPASGISVDGFDSLYGRPVIPVEYCAALGTVGDIILVDLSQYLLIKKGGVNQASSMHVKFTTDEMTFRATYRVDGQPGWSSALTPFKGTSGNTLSPYVTLASRS